MLTHTLTICSPLFGEGWKWAFSYGGGQKLFFFGRRYFMLRSYSLHLLLTYIFLGAIGGVWARVRSGGLFNGKKTRMSRGHFSVYRQKVGLKNWEKEGDFWNAERKGWDWDNFETLQDSLKVQKTRGVQKLKSFFSLLNGGVEKSYLIGCWYFMLRSYSLHNQLVYIFLCAIGGVWALVRSGGLFNHQKIAMGEVIFCV